MERLKQGALFLPRTRLLQRASRQPLAFLPVLNVQPGGSGSSWDMRSLSATTRGVAALLTTCTKTPFYCRCVITCVRKEADFTVSTSVEEEFGHREPVRTQHASSLVFMLQCCTFSLILFIIPHLYLSEKPNQTKPNQNFNPFKLSGRTTRLQLGFLFVGSSLHTFGRRRKQRVLRGRSQHLTSAGYAHLLGSSLRYLLPL